MDINVQHYLNRTADEQVKHFDQLTTPAAVADTEAMVAALQPLADAVVDAVNQGELIRATLTLQGTEPTLISFETGIINLPLANAKKVGGFFEADEIVPVNVYLVTENKFLNASGLRIDELATTDDFVAKAVAYTQLAATTAVEQVAHITEEAAKPAPVVKEVPANKAKTTKKTTRRTTAKKTTTKRKTTAKKSTTTRKRTTAKKAAK
ncbi:hypothetical protein PQ472_11345 [Lacticaseibacillus pabuli]|uniref:Uncharacterized protein n=1 Tax=Lacticaseibacillus pabuli TaxID=3025672 RepID=A0ABY7WQJ8_9LACO|nr:hypothetical protein [Lacticaseibacillus sp. KACC 23028]WDF82472.1 hypothetical protein PQ472_11345 [Lacticaseibacillus sp. KACC 23028]